MDVFMCDTCKTVEPTFRKCTITHPERDPIDVCIRCVDLIDAFVRSITLPFKEKPPEAP